MDKTEKDVRIVVDAMGGDNGPSVVVEGVVKASQEFGCRMILTGNKEIIEKELAKYSYDPAKISVVHTTQVIEMAESPVTACKQKTDSSIMVGARLLKEGKADAFVSAGNTGAMGVASLFTLGKLKGIDRPGIVIMQPTLRGFFVLVDAGATVDCKPKNLLQFGIMGSIFMKSVYNYKNPRIGLLSVGEEPTKGDELTIAAHELLKTSGLNFVGNIEGSDIVGNKVDVIVCNGFVGNIVLKFTENLFRTAGILVRREFQKQKIVPSVFKEAFGNFKKKVDYAEYGGAPLLGVNGTVVISHGKSSAKAIKNAIRVASEEVTHDLNKHIVEYMEKFEGV